MCDSVVRVGEQALKHIQWSPVKTSIFTATLARLKNTIEKQLSKSWSGVANPANGVLEIEAPKDLVRLWSCLQFIYCSPPLELTAQQVKEGKQKIIDIENWGDGFFWAGATLLHLMGFRPRFELLDFSYHIQKLYEMKPIDLSYDPKAKVKKGAPQISDQDKVYIPAVRYFLDNVNWVKDRFADIFSCLESYLKVDPARPLRLKPSGELSNMITPGVGARLEIKESKAPLSPSHGADSPKAPLASPHGMTGAPMPPPVVNTGAALPPPPPGGDDVALPPPPPGE
jgi:hypothetical protein